VQWDGQLGRTIVHPNEPVFKIKRTIFYCNGAHLQMKAIEERIKMSRSGKVLGDKDWKKERCMQ